MTMLLIILITTTKHAEPTNDNTNEPTNDNTNYNTNANTNDNTNDNTNGRRTLRVDAYAASAVTCAKNTPQHVLYT